MYLMRLSWRQFEWLDQLKENRQAGSTPIGEFAIVLVVLGESNGRIILGEIPELIG